MFLGKKIVLDFEIVCKIMRKTSLIDIRLIGYKMTRVVLHGPSHVHQLKVMKISVLGILL